MFFNSKRMSASTALAELQSSVIEGRQVSVQAVVAVQVSHDQLKQTLEAVHRHFQEEPDCDPGCLCVRHTVQLIVQQLADEARNGQMH